jgi:hypothetical protein
MGHGATRIEKFHSCDPGRPPRSRADLSQVVGTLGIMPDLSFSPIGDAAAVAALLWTVWHDVQKKS